MGSKFLPKAGFDIQFKKVVIAPLFWGLGHATRCIPVIERLLDHDNEVFLAGDGDALKLLCKEYPTLPYFTLPGYDITYRHRSMSANMIVQSPRILTTLTKELGRSKEIAQKTGADVFISDNRFGFRAPTTTNIYITHQLRIIANNRWASRLATGIHRHYIQKFDVCWVPDYADYEVSIAKKLSHGPLSIPVQYIGPQSRMVCEDAEMRYDIIVILSGPEPQRTALEKILYETLSREHMHQKICFVRGVDTRRPPYFKGVFDEYDLLDTPLLNKLINQSGLVICRAGYSSVMDLIVLKKTAILIPTPGQYEQEYLADILDGKYGFTMLKQEDIINKGIWVGM